MSFSYTPNTENHLTIVCTFMNARQLTLVVSDETTVGSLLAQLSGALGIDQGRLKLFHHTTPISEGMIVEEATVENGVCSVSCVVIAEEIDSDPQKERSP